MKKSTIRLDSFLAGKGICARRKAADYLKSHRVTVEGQRVLASGQRIDPNSEIFIDGKKIQQPELVYYMYHKPLGLISTTSDEFGRQTVISGLPEGMRLYPVGRLDKNTTGLLLVTNDGELTYKLTHPSNQVEKVYELSIKGPVTDSQLHILQKGVKLSDGRTAPAKIISVNISGGMTYIKLSIHEGRNRQVRRMCGALRIPLMALKRIQIGPLELGDLKIGQYRQLTDDEISALK